MFQVRFHGRGGQGVVTAAVLLSIATFKEGHHAQATPSFGSERTGAPVVSYCRIDDKEIRSREPIMQPDAVIIQDPTLLHSIDVFEGLKETGYAIINSSKNTKELGIEEQISYLKKDRIFCIDATRIAMKHIGRPLPNAVLLGAFAACSKLLKIESVEQAIVDRLPGRIGESNVAAARNAFNSF